MPPYLPGKDYDDPPGPSWLESRQADRPAGQPAPQCGRRPPHAVPPLPRQPQLSCPQPWPLQQLPVDLDAEPGIAPGEPHQPAPHAANTRAPARARTSGAAIAYTTLGFLAGVVFWHAVGFWTLVHDAVFSGPRLEARTEPLDRALAPPPVVPFDEEKLRDHARRPTAADVDAWQAPQNVTTGSINSPSADAAMPARPQVRAPAPVDDRRDAPPVLTTPGGITWQPAVSKAP